MRLVDLKYYWIIFVIFFDSDEVAFIIPFPSFDHMEWSELLHSHENIELWMVYFLIQEAETFLQLRIVSSIWNIFISKKKQVVSHLRMRLG
mgnify:CR=1 FL=1